jgi:hypothetical protein
MKIKDAVVIDRVLLLDIVSVLYGTDIKIEYQDLEPIVKDAYNAGSAYTIGSHEFMKQTHKNLNDYLNDKEI